jgi:hypothetical protein
VRDFGPRVQAVREFSWPEDPATKECIYMYESFVNQFLWFQTKDNGDIIFCLEPKLRQSWVSWVKNRKNSF